jgi:hypothetical protein
VNLISFYISVPFLVGIYLMIYQVAVILLLSGTCFKNRFKSESYNLLYVFNTLAAWSSLFIVLACVADLFMAWYGQNPYEWYAFSGQMTWEYWIWFFIINLLSFLLGFFFFFRKLRIKRWFTLLFFLSNCSFFFERIVIFITGLYRDYLPSSWSSYAEHTYSRYLYSYAFIILLLVVIYLWAKKKGRLPFPSVFLK